MAHWLARAGLAIQWCSEDRPTLHRWSRLSTIRGCLIFDRVGVGLVQRVGHARLAALGLVPGAIDGRTVDDSDRETPHRNSRREEGRCCILHRRSRFACIDLQRRRSKFFLIPVYVACSRFRHISCRGACVYMVHIVAREVLSRRGGSRLSERLA